MSIIKVEVTESMLLTLLKWVIIGFELIVIIVLLGLSFIWFQKKTVAEQEIEIEQQKRQSELK